MILAMSIGNTNFVFAQKDNDVIKIKRHETTSFKTKKDFSEIITNMMECTPFDSINQKNIEGVIISSVVPSLTPKLIEAIQHLFGIMPIVVNADINMALDLSRYNKNQIGNDRITICEAAISKYNTPIIIFDFGTATTINVIDHKHSFLGGSILTGVTMGLDSLSKNTAQLPKSEICKADARLLGVNTEECLISGAVYGNAAMMEGMVERIEYGLGQKATVIVTGGNAKFVLPFCKTNFIYDQDLQVKGLYELYNKNAIIHQKSCMV